MHPHEHPPVITDAAPSFSDRQAVRRRRYFAIMGVCLTLIVLSWCVVRFFSVGAALAMSVVAMFLPPVAAFVANRGADRGLM